MFRKLLLLISLFSSLRVSSQVLGRRHINDTDPPQIPIFDTLSVGDDNKAVMSWKANDSLDAAGYVVYRFNGTSWPIIDTVWGRTTTFYKYNLSTAGVASEKYRLAAFDTALNISPQGEIKNTMYLKAVPHICDRSVTLSWTACDVFESNLGGYNIYRSTVGVSGPYLLVGNVAKDILTYTSTGLAPSTTYYFKIEAVNSDESETASSNRINFYSAVPIPPQYSYIRYVTVVSKNRVDVIFHVDVAASTLKYKIMRSLDAVPEHFVQIGTKPASKSTPVTFSDTKVNSDQVYYYKIINVDSCGFDGIESNVSNTILLSAKSNSSDMTNTLSWNDYKSWLGTVASYNIYRGIGGVFDSTPIANVPYTGSGINTYTDNIASLLQGSGTFSYYIEALEGTGDIVYHFMDKSKSNVAEAYQESIIYIPNAFDPSGANPIFIPVTTYIDYTEYEFYVFNRKGATIFSTTDIHQGWDGTSRGDKQELGVYVYLIRLKTSRGKYIEYKGTVLLLR
jgi:hypothetical protein